MNELVPTSVEVLEEPNDVLIEFHREFARTHLQLIVPGGDDPPRLHCTWCKATWEDFETDPTFFHKSICPLSGIRAAIVNMDLYDIDEIERRLGRRMGHGWIDWRI